uniref:beta-carotene isomerase D27, chloroplastic isoform X1 n=1 Tax=Fragaria vesca subsp. vesca TaxID=101020 RepID=UPI0005CA1A4F|nr:PREDICTED: beta-carotene isomerase D27, chloroplastic isoform X1 [Fragaria vesca subsp. vesca]
MRLRKRNGGNMTMRVLWMSPRELCREGLAFSSKKWLGRSCYLCYLQFRKLFPPTKWAAEFNAALTVPFFHWLVGPSEVIEVEVEGVKQRSGVRIKKCRYLENSGCVGMCVNMCKFPTQDFFTNEFGLPLTMIPNFEDMSCDMVYGQVPPPFEEDPVSKQPCFTDICSIANPSATVCPKLQA